MAQVVLGDTLRNVAGPLADLANKLAGPDGNTRWLPGLKRFLRGENPWEGHPFAVWKTIEIGVYQSVTELVAAVEAAPFSLSGDNPREFRTSLLNGNLTLSSRRTSRHLIKVNIPELDTNWNVLPAIVREMGFEPCTIEMALMARLRYVEQPRGESECLIHDPLLVAHQEYNLFFEHDYMEEPIGLGLAACTREEINPLPNQFICCLPE